MAEEPVGVDGRRGDGLAHPRRKCGHTGSEVVLGGRQPNPVLERVDRSRRRNALADEQQPGYTRRSDTLEAGLFFGKRINTTSVRDCAFATPRP